MRMFGWAGRGASDGACLEGTEGGPGRGWGWRCALAVGLLAGCLGVGLGAGTVALAAPAGGPSRAAGTVPGPVERGPQTVRQVAFAVNVVWGTEYVLPIARAFETAHGHATFFLGGAWARAHPTEARELRAMGMEIASHGDRHRHVGSLSLEENLEELDRANTAIEAATGVRPRLYAPAYGELAPAVLEAAHMRKMPVVMWTIDTIDWRTWHTPDIIKSRVLRRLVPGAIILTHPTDRTLEALPDLLREIRSQGYHVVTISTLLAPAGRTLEDHGSAGVGKAGAEPLPGASRRTGSDRLRGTSAFRTASGMPL